MAERINPFLAMANKNNEKNSQDMKENPESPIKYGDELEESPKATEKPAPAKEVKPEKKAQETKKETKPAAPKAEKKPKPTKTAKTGSDYLVEEGINYKVDLKSANLKRKGVDLLKDNDAYISARSRELGMKIQDYFSLLVLEDVARIDANGIDLDEELVLEATTQGKETSRRTVVMEERTFIAIKRNSAKCAMKETQYLNYLVSAERRREDTNGLRKGLYD